MHAVIRKASGWGGERELGRFDTPEAAQESMTNIIAQIVLAGSGTRAEFERESKNFEIREV